jgi:hypothetical protein
VGISFPEVVKSKGIVSVSERVSLADKPEAPAQLMAAAIERTIPIR